MSDLRYSPYGSPEPGTPAPYAAPPRPSAPPSTGAGWTVVAMLSWWPFGLAAYPHAQRANAALAGGDYRLALAEAARARRIGIAGLVYAIIMSCVLAVAMMVGLFVLGFHVAGAEAAAQRESVTGLAADDEPGSGPADGTDVWELHESDCYLVDGLTDVVRTVAVVPCAEPHGGEAYEVTYVAASALEQAGHGGNDPTYPGDAWLARYVDEVCRAKLEERPGTPAADTGLHHWFLAPDAWDWRLHDQRIVCLVESDADDLTGRVGDR